MFILIKFRPAVLKIWFGQDNKEKEIKGNKYVMSERMV